MEKKTKNSRNYFDYQELLSLALEKVQKDPFWLTYADKLENMSFNQKLFAEEIKSCAFDAYSETMFGSNEGIWTDVIFLTQNGPVRVLSLKTLYTSKSSYLMMAHMGALFSYAVREVVNENLDRFD
jgi:hypothetical protein